MTKKRKLNIGPKKGPPPDINVTPLVDVVLVLLIIFMVVTPLVERELKVATPPMENIPEPPPPDPNNPQLMLEVKPDPTDATGNAVIYTVNDEPIAEPQLVSRLTAMLNAKSDKIVFFLASDDASYAGAVVALDDAKAAGAKTIGMLTEPLPGAGGPDDAPGAPGAPGTPTPPTPPTPPPH
jgi:biopolymer transport protein ExbD